MQHKDIYTSLSHVDHVLVRHITPNVNKQRTDGGVITHDISRLRKVIMTDHSTAGTATISENDK